MKPLLIYLAGVATPFAVVLLWLLWIIVIDSFIDRRARRRNERAWKQAEAEFKTLLPEMLAECQVRWASDPDRFAWLANDQTRYFVMRWNGGNQQYDPDFPPLLGRKISPP